MDASAISTMVAATVAAVSALLSAWYAQRSARASRLSAAENLAVKFREPLLQAAFNLQSRLYNIARGDFLNKFKHSGRVGDEDYPVDNTLYLIGQYMCWVEIVRRESQFLDPRSEERERAVADQIEKARRAFASSDFASAELRIFRGQQRAIGELLLEPVALQQPGCPRWDSMGYAQFVERVHEDSLGRWFSALKNDVDVMATQPVRGLDRLVAIQRALLEVVDLLDPEALRTSGRLRERL
jgi:hypothetical protein